MHSNNLMSPGEVARLLGVSLSSMKRWAIEGLIPCSHRTLKGWRRYSPADVEVLRAKLGRESVSQN